MSTQQAKSLSREGDAPDVDGFIAHWACLFFPEKIIGLVSKQEIDVVIIHNHVRNVDCMIRAWHQLHRIHASLPAARLTVVPLFGIPYTPILFS